MKNSDGKEIPPVRFISQKIAGGDWRHSVYQRMDGTEFHVALPPIGLVDKYSKTHAGNFYNEAAEADMILRLAEGSTSSQTENV